MDSNGPCLCTIEYTKVATWAYRGWSWYFWRRNHPNVIFPSSSRWQGSSKLSVKASKDPARSQLFHVMVSAWILDWVGICNSASSWTPLREDMQVSNDCCKACTRHPLSSQSKTMKTMKKWSHANSFVVNAAEQCWVDKDPKMSGLIPLRTSPVESGQPRKHAWDDQKRLSLVRKCHLV